MSIVITNQKSELITLNILMYVPCILYSLLYRPTNAQQIYINNILYIIYIWYIYRWPYIFYTNSLQDYTYKTVQIVYTATKLTTSMYCNYNSWQLTACYTLYFIIIYNDQICKHFNLLILLIL